MELSRVAALAVVESVVFGLVARHAYHEALPAAVPLTLTYLFLLPMAVGYRTVAASDERRLGALTPSAILLMVLAAGVALGGAGVLCVLVLMPLLMAMALLGGALASMVRGTRRAAARIAARLTRIAGSLRGTAGGEWASPAASPRAVMDRARPGADPRDAWRAGHHPHPVVTVCGAGFPSGDSAPWRKRERRDPHGGGSRRSVFPPCNYIHPVTLSRRRSMRELDSRTGIFTVRNGQREEIRIERPDHRMLDIYASWTPQRRLKAVADMGREARAVMAAGVRQQHPDWSEAEVKKEVARRHRGHR